MCARYPNMMQCFSRCIIYIKQRLFTLNTWVLFPPYSSFCNYWADKGHFGSNEYHYYRIIKCVILAIEHIIHRCTISAIFTSGKWFVTIVLLQPFSRATLPSNIHQLPLIPCEWFMAIYMHEKCRDVELRWIMATHLNHMLKIHFLKGNWIFRLICKLTV